jgi:hypothetical protein
MTAMKSREGSDINRLRSGRHEFDNGAYYELRAASEGGFAIERLFVPEELRGNRIHRTMLAIIISEADVDGVWLSMAIAPDRLENEALDSPRYCKVVDALVDSSASLGFKAYVDGEDEYRLDRVRLPYECKLA